MNTPEKVPVTILTGFLGAGKTTLLNRILSEHHGKRIAVIENEFGQINIDQALVINADEEVFEMSNGCICCTVRGDLIRVLGNLMKRRDKFDYVLVETTGLADPGPVAQTFFMDDEIRDGFSLDGIITVVDALHVHQQLGRSDECTEQIAFADVILLNKTDLVTDADLDVLEARVRGMNALARVRRCIDADVPVVEVLDLSAFDLGQTLTRRPTFLEPEYPFEWTGLYDLPAGRHVLTLDDGPDPTMQLVVFTGATPDDAWLRDGAERCVRLYATPPKPVERGATLPLEQHAQLTLSAPGPSRFILHLEAPTMVALYAQHLAEEFNLRVTIDEPVELGPEPLHTMPRPLVPFAVPLAKAVRAPTHPVAERVWVAQHEHDDEVSSVAIDVEGVVHPGLFSEWIGALLRERGQDIFRMKGFLNIDGEERRFVFQGVHMLFTGQGDRLWGDLPRRNQLVFIGRDLDRDVIVEGFFSCLL